MGCVFTELGGETGITVFDMLRGPNVSVWANLVMAAVMEGFGLVVCMLPAQFSSRDCPFIYFKHIVIGAFINAREIELVVTESGDS